jgi:hypothetical protein
MVAFRCTLILDGAVALILILNLIKNAGPAEHRWLSPVILATWEAEIRRISV